MAAPQGALVPLFYATVDPTGAGSDLVDARPALFIGQRLSTGSVAADVPTQIASVSAAVDAFGRGSQLHEMFAGYFANNQTGTVWAVGVDDAAGTQATATITITGPATANGTIFLRIGGTRVDVAVADGDTANDIAAAIDAAVTANLDLPVTSGVVTNVVTLTARHAGTIGNAIDVRDNYGGPAVGEVTPAGVTVAIVAMAGGATDPTYATALTALGSVEFDYIGLGLATVAVLDELETFMDDSAGRWSPLDQVYGHVFTAANGTQAALSAIGTLRNDQHMTIEGTDGSPTSPWVRTGALIGQVKTAGDLDPARPFQSLPLVGVLAPAIEDRFTWTEANTLLGDGISTTYVGPGATVRIQRLVTTYQQDAFGSDDDALRDVNTLLTIMRIIRAMRTRITSKYPRHKLANDGTRFSSNAAVVTPSIIRGELIALYQELEADGLVENTEAFIAALTVDRDGTDPNRVNVCFPADLVNQLRIFDAIIKPRLQLAA